jgi:hypothetical protein
MIIKNGKDMPLNQNSGTLPDVSGAMLDYFQPMVFAVVVKTVDNFQAVETKSSVNFQGVWQPLSARQLMLKPEGQRAWKWFQVHAEPALILQTDQLITYLGVQYRVMADKDYRLYGYVEYHLVEDFTGSGPQEATS